MGWTDLSKFDFKDRENVFLFYKRKNPFVWALMMGAVLAVVVTATPTLIDPDVHRPLRGRGAWLIALMLFLPLAVRALLCALVLGLVMEGIYRRTLLTYDKLPDLAIGPSGVAQLDPWRPRALNWQEIGHIRRYVTKSLLDRDPKLMSLAFTASRPPPEWLPTWLWELCPGYWTDRGIAIVPDSFGLTEAEVLATIERFAGKIPITEHDVTP